MPPEKAGKVIHLRRVSQNNGRPDSSPLRRKHGIPVYCEYPLSELRHHRLKIDTTPQSETSDIAAFTLTGRFGAPFED